MDELQGYIECIPACEVPEWPDCGRASNTFTHPTLYQVAKPPKLFRKFRT